MFKKNKNSIKLKNLNLSLVVLIICTWLFSSCKYDEGPIISFTKAKHRVTGSYRLVKFYVNDIDTTNYYLGLMCNIGFSFGFVGDSEEGRIEPNNPDYSPNCPNDFRAIWRLTDDNRTIEILQWVELPILGPWGQFDSFKWNIIKLTKDEMHLGGKSFDTTYRLEFKKL